MIDILGTALQLMMGMRQRFYGFYVTEKLEYGELVTAIDYSTVRRIVSKW
jgi:hypothetical protein